MFDLIKTTPITLTIAAISILSFLFPAITGAMELDTTTNLLSQIPQLFSCHTLHWSLNHLSWDLMMFVLVGGICERRNQVGYSVVLFLSALLIPGFVTHLGPSLDSYRGLSGLDTGIFAFAAVMLFDEAVKERNWQSAVIYSALFMGMLGKIVYELSFGGTLFVEGSDFTPVPIAHLIGAIIGIAVAAIYTLPSKGFREGAQSSPV